MQPPRRTFTKAVYVVYYWYRMQDPLGLDLVGSRPYPVIALVSLVPKRFLTHRYTLSGEMSLRLHRANLV